MIGSITVSHKEYKALKRVLNSEEVYEYGVKYYEHDVDLLISASLEAWDRIHLIVNSLKDSS
jgi:hypothetical protein